jgi:tetratricopeptide (TPR) repeat protein
MSVTVKAVLLTGTISSCAIALHWHALPEAAQAQSESSISAPLLAAPGDPQRLRDEIKSVEGLLPRLPDRGAALYLLAHHYARLGEQAKALALLKECVALDEGFNPAKAKAFALLKSDGEFRALVERVRRRYPPDHRVHVAFTVAQNDLFPEGLAVDAPGSSSTWAACTTIRSSGSPKQARSQTL